MANSPKKNSNPYMGAPVIVIPTPGSRAKARLSLLLGLKKEFPSRRKIIKLNKNIHTVWGYSLAPSTYIETDDGLIVFGTGDTRSDGEALIKAIRTKTQKPIKVLIYGHSHTAMGASAMVQDCDGLKVLGHKNLNQVVEKNIKSGGVPAYYPELGPYLKGRTAIQFNAYVPLKGHDAAVMRINLPDVVPAFIKVNTPVNDGEVHEILGEKMQFFTRFHSDDEVQTSVWLPDRKILFTTLLWISPPQLYSLRGSVFRDPRSWISGLIAERNLEPEILVSGAAPPVKGKEKIRKLLQGYADGASFVLDQSLRGILLGKTPYELSDMVEFPHYLKKVPNNLECYGELRSYSPAIYYQAIGWYDNDAANLKPLSFKEEAVRMIPLLGGRDKIIESANKAFEEKEYAWAAKLINYVYIVNPYDLEARELKAKILRRMSYVGTGANERAHFTSQALALEGKVAIPTLIFPSEEEVAASPQDFLNYFRVRIDPEKSGETDCLVSFDFRQKIVAGLHVRRAVAEYIPDITKYSNEPDCMLQMTPQAWAKLYLNKQSAKELHKTGELKITKGQEKLFGVFNLFDNYRENPQFVVPPVLSEYAAE